VEGICGCFASAALGSGSSEGSSGKSGSLLIHKRQLSASESIHGGGSDETAAWSHRPYRQSGVWRTASVGGGCRHPTGGGKALMGRAWV